MRRSSLIALILGVTLAVAACSGDTVPVTTSSSTTTLVTTTTTPDGRVTLTANGPAFILEGTRGPFVEALQHYLVCTDHAQPTTGGGSVSVDGVFGPITADAVAYYQAELRRIPTGDPDEDTFASLARDCDADRTIEFEAGTNTKEVAGNAAPNDDDILVLAGQDGQVLSIQLTEGAVTITVIGPDGSPIDGATATNGWEAELPADGDYRIQVAADSASSYLLTFSTRSPNVVASNFGPMVLEPDGISIADFGENPDNTIAVVSLVLGEPWVDTGWQEGVPGCTGSNRHVTWPIQQGPDDQSHPAALELHFSDLGGAPFFAQYAYRSDDLDTLDPIAQGLTTADGVSLGTDLETFTDIYGEVVFFDPLRGLTEFDDEMLAGFEQGDEPVDRLVWYIGAGADGCTDFG